jgi:hypothetical protein
MRTVSARGPWRDVAVMNCRIGTLDQTGPSIPAKDLRGIQMRTQVQFFINRGCHP